MAGIVLSVLVFINSCNFNNNPRRQLLLLVPPFSGEGSRQREVMGPATASLWQSWDSSFGSLARVPRTFLC